MAHSSTPTPTTPTTPFGRAMLEKYFLIDDTYTNLNHGSFGTYPRPVLEQLHHFQRAAERRPDPFTRYAMPGLLQESREALAPLLHVPASEIVLVANATTGVNTVLRNLTYGPGQAIVYFSTTYAACQHTIEYVAETTAGGARPVQIALDYPMSDDELVDRFRAVLRREAATERGGVKVALLDTVVSMPGVRMPFERLVAVCRDEGVLSLVDGAHGVGHLPLDLARLDADFFVSNCHKWLFVPRGCAVFHVPARNQALIRSSLPTSFGFAAARRAPAAPATKAIVNPVPIASTKTPFVALFDYVGTIDYSPYLCIGAALRFRADVCGGEDAIRAYCFGLAREAGVVVAAILGTDVLPVSEEHATCFANVRLPLDVLGEDKDKDDDDDRDLVGPGLAQHVMHALAHHHHTFLAVVYHAGACWARLSAQIYLERDDFVRGARALKAVCDGVNRRGGVQAVAGAEQGVGDVQEGVMKLAVVDGVEAGAAAVPVLPEADGEKMRGEEKKKEEETTMKD
ncbi:MAG: hypothetical protein M1826_004633 [Phylliscum demangeonii]|nr:MAG: hypothetical protein M1826_004633 [Phylliscum demangeonii]